MELVIMQRCQQNRALGIRELVNHSADTSSTASTVRQISKTLAKLAASIVVVKSAASNLVRSLHGSGQVCVHACVHARTFTSLCEGTEPGMRKQASGGSEATLHPKLSSEKSFRVSKTGPMEAWQGLGI